MERHISNLLSLLIKIKGLYFGCLWTNKDVFHWRETKGIKKNKTKLKSLWYDKAAAYESDVPPLAFKKRSQEHKRMRNLVITCFNYKHQHWAYDIPAWRPSCVPVEWRSEPHTTAWREDCQQGRCSSSPGSWFWPARCWRHCRPHQWSWSSVCSLNTQNPGTIIKLPIESDYIVS